jgi:hypothetical protein
VNVLDPVDLVVEAVCRLPIDYEQFRTHSAGELVRRSGYHRHRADVTVDRIRMCLARHPDWIDSWFAWSDETPSPAHWYIRRCDVDSFEVGFLDASGLHSVTAFDDELSACADYVSRELESTFGDA